MIDHVVISLDAPPMHGGAHSWLYEVYRRWPDPAEFWTKASTAQDQRIKERGESSFLVRALKPVNDIDFRRPGFLTACIRNAYRVRRALGVNGRCIHVLRAFPEGIIGLCAKLMSFGRIELVTYAHGEEVFVARSSRQLALVASLVYRYSDRVIANSENTRNLVESLCHRASVRVVHPGVDFAEIAAKSRVEFPDVRHSRGWDSDCVIAITVARMERRKNQEAVIRSIAKLRKEGLNLAYVCVGDGVLRQHLEDLSRSLGIEQAVFFPGGVGEAEKFALIAQADFFVMPSVRHAEMIEGFGMVFLEAGCAGLPSVSGNCGGQPEAVKDGETGIVVDGDCQDDLTSAMRSLSQDHSLRSRLGEGAKRWAQAHDWELVVQRTLCVLAGDVCG